MLQPRLFLYRLALAVSIVVTMAIPACGQFVEQGSGRDASVQTSHVRAELLLGSSSYAPAATGDVALVLHLEPGWHVYWLQAGDSGEPPSVDWVLPHGLHLGKMEFPAPMRLPLGPLMDYGYQGTAVFPFALRTDAALPLGTLPLQAHVRWLVCREVCVPGRAFLGAGLVIARTAAATSNPLIAQARQREPKPLPSSFDVQTTASRDRLKLVLGAGRRETSAAFYPFDEATIRNAAAQVWVPSSQGGSLELERGDASTTLPKRLSGVLELSDGRSFLLDVPVTAGRSGAAQPERAYAAGLALPLLLAFAGGIVLNLMPCVFPVLFLKALALIGSAGEERRAHRLHGAAYTAGILISFWSIVAVLLALRAAGHQAGWGFQLQSPTFVVLMASLLFFMVLSLAGQFDLGLSLTGKGEGLTRRSGLTGSFFTGVLATVVATPCTAPLMGAAIGYALSQPALVTFTIFTALALPYLLFTLNPAWASLLPKPGRWMETLKQATAVPLLLTVVWLVAVYGRLYSVPAGLRVRKSAVSHGSSRVWYFLRSQGGRCSAGRPNAQDG